LKRGVVGVRFERCELNRHPYVQRQHGKNVLHLALVVGTPQTKCAPLSWLNGRPPKAKQMTLCGEFGGANRFSPLGVVHFGLRSPLRHIGPHVGEKLHTQLLFSVFRHPQRRWPKRRSQEDNFILRADKVHDF
jgi:hypothetical protein